MKAKISQWSKKPVRKIKRRNRRKETARVIRAVEAVAQNYLPLVHRAQVGKKMVARKK